MNAQQRAKKAKKAFDLFEQAYVIANEMIVGMYNEEWVDAYAKPTLDEAHDVIKFIRQNYEREAEEAKRRVE